jgi:hypothetical protein
VAGKPKYHAKAYKRRTIEDKTHRDGTDIEFYYFTEESINCQPYRYI